MIGVAWGCISISRVEKWKSVKMQAWLFHSTAESVCGILPPNENKPKHIVQSLAVLLHCLMHVRHLCL